MKVFPTVKGKVRNNLQALAIILFALAIFAGYTAVLGYGFWCMVIAFSGGTIPLLGWKLDGGFWTGLFWMFVISPLIMGIGVVPLKLLAKRVFKVDPPSAYAEARQSASAQTATDQRGDHMPEIPVTPDLSSLSDIEPVTLAFDADAESYSQKNAVACAAAAWLAYLSQESIGLGAEVLGLPQDSVQLIEKENHACLVLSRSDFMIVAFRGTDDLKDWRTNLKYKATPGNWGNVHSGYKEAVSLLWDELGSLAWVRVTGEQTLWMTGHSMGGALATLAAANLLADGGCKVAGLYTFGQPAVGDEEFNRKLVDNLGQRYYRFANVADIVAEETFSKFRHTGQFKYIDRGGHIHHGKTRRMHLDPLFARMFNSQDRTPAQITDHSMMEYLKAIERNADAASARLTTKEKRGLGLWIGFQLSMLGGLSYLWWITSGVLAFFLGVGVVMTLVHTVCAFVFPRAYFDHLKHLFDNAGF